MAVTQKDIADRLGVSHQLVSIALKDHPRVSAETRNRIKQVAGELGYDATANAQARAMAAIRHGRRPRTGIIAMMLGRIADGMPQDEPFMHRWLSAVAAEADSRGLVLALCYWIGTQDYYNHALAKKLVDGVIMTSPPSPMMEYVRNTDLPAVSVFASLLDIPVVRPDERLGARLATEHLIGLGHRKIAYLGQVSTFRSQVDRFSGYGEALAANGIAIDESRVELTLFNPNVACGTDGMTRLLDRTTDFTSVVCYNDTIAAGAILALNARGLRVPQDVSVVGFDNISDGYRFDVPITSIDFSRAALAKRSLDSLSQQIDAAIDDKNVVQAAPTETVIPVELVVRESTGPILS